VYSILLVDDEKTIREYLPKAIPFEEYGFQIKHTATNGQEALDKLPNVKPDLILLDVRMPIMDGLQFLNILRQGQFRNTLVIMLSGYSDFAYAKEAIKYGVEAYLNKPVDEEEIIPLLEKMRRKLDEYHHEMSLGLVRKHVNMLNNLYNGAGVDRQIFYDDTLMTCVLLPCPNDFENDNPHLIMQRCLAKLFGEPEAYLFRAIGSQYTYLLPSKIFEPFHHNKKSFSGHLLGMFKENKIDCALLFDSYVFRHQENTFREDFAHHMQRMLTELFFAPTDYMDYQSGQFKMSEELYLECKYLEEIKQHFSSYHKAELLKTVEQLMTEIQKAHLGVHYIQEISYRIYYIIRSEIAVSDNQNQGKEILARPEWLDCPYFLSFQQWKEMLFALIMDGFVFIERRCKMVNLGISREVIEFVHLHYMEPINLKQIADQFFVNAVYLGRAFQKATGVNFKQYVNHIRIAEAKKLLLYTNKLIYEIANEVGYTDSKYFIVKFTQEVGKSPTEYRRGLENGV
jgi:two-component system response regulator YesN